MAADMEHTESDIWASPDRDDHHVPRPKTPKTPMTPKTPTGRDRQPEPVDREAALRRELQGVRDINESIEGLLATLDRAGGNMEVVCKTVANASTLLNTWTRILSQTEHNQRLVLHPSWKGATEDLAEQEAEALERQRAVERRAAEEEERREDLRRRREEEEERRRLGASNPSRGARGAPRTRGTISRGRAVSRVATGSHYQSEASKSRLVPGTRGAPGVGRGTGTGRGRSRAAR